MVWYSMVCFGWNRFLRGKVLTPVPTDQGGSKQEEEEGGGDGCEGNTATAGEEVTRYKS